VHDHGRTLVFWGEYPLKPPDIPSLPAHLVNGETHGHEFDGAFKAHGTREMVYVSTQAEERIFPDYFILPQSGRLHAGRGGSPPIPEAIRTISSDHGFRLRTASPLDGP
jgi:hypothetical protein